MAEAKGKIAIVGSGLIGRCWASVRRRPRRRYPLALLSFSPSLRLSLSSPCQLPTVPLPSDSLSSRLCPFRYGRRRGGHSARPLFPSYFFFSSCEDRRLAEKHGPLLLLRRSRCTQLVARGHDPTHWHHAAGRASEAKRRGPFQSDVLTERERVSRLSLASLSPFSSLLWPSIVRKTAYHSPSSP